jgi:hypothetical protein
MKRENCVALFSDEPSNVRQQLHNCKKEEEEEAM